jgi:hypothetical protein
VVLVVVPAAAEAVAVVSAVEIAAEAVVDLVAARKNATNLQN